MIRRVFYITKVQFDKLLALSEETGLSLPEHVRRAIDDYLVRWGRSAKKEER